jgi:hypothetical protein
VTLGGHARAARNSVVAAGLFAVGMCAFAVMMGLNAVVGGAFQKHALSALWRGRSDERP